MKLKYPKPTIRNQIGKIDFKGDVKEENLRVYIPRRVYEKLYALTMIAEGETSAFGSLHLEQDGKRALVGDEIWIDDIHFLNNNSTTGGTVLDSADISRLQINLAKKGKDLLGLRFWFHTHYNFSVFWSGTDDYTARKTLENSRWTLSIVMNQRAEILARVDIYQPTHRMINNIPIWIVSDAPKEKWMRYCNEARKKINNGTVIENHTPKLTESIKEDLRSRGIVVDSSDIKKEEVKKEEVKKAEGPELSDIFDEADLQDYDFSELASKDKALTREHKCSCGQVLVVNIDWSYFKCLTCNRMWISNAQRKDFPNKDKDDFVDRIYKKAIKAQADLKAGFQVSASFGRMIDITWHPERHIFVAEKASNIKSFSVIDNSIWYDILTGDYISFVYERDASTAMPEEFFKERFIDLDERQIKNRITAYNDSIDQVSKIKLIGRRSFEGTAPKIQVPEIKRRRHRDDNDPFRYESFRKLNFHRNYEWDPRDYGDHDYIYKNKLKVKLRLDPNDSTPVVE